MTNWNIYGELYPPQGIEVLAQSDNWIDEDINPRGIRLGFQDISEDDQGEFVSAKYNDYQDQFDTDRETKPDFWKFIN